MDPFSIVLVVGLIFVGAPLAVFGGISMIRRQGLDKKRLAFEQEKLEVEKQKVRLMQLQIENKLLDNKLEDEFRSAGLSSDEK
jgi:hypothetical protein